MGITNKSLDRLQPYLKQGIKMLELGAQNIYSAENYGEIAKDYFKRIGIAHMSIDIIEHQMCVQADLRQQLKIGYDFDVVTNFGTTEHIDGSLYQPFKNIHEACKVGGVMIHENPKTGNWPGHGQHYFTQDFYAYLATQCGYDLIEVTEEAAMSNVTDGWNVCAVLRKMKDEKFISKKEFELIYKKHIHAK